MAVSLQTQWTLVASGLVAHADHVLAGEECDRLMAMVEREVDGDEYAEWMGAIGDPTRLETLLEGLEAPPASTHREILEEAWLMAVVDGERADEELETLRRIAGRLGVSSEQLDGWREAWTEAQHGYADVAAAALAWVLGGGEAVPSDDRSVVVEFVHALPTTHEHRERLLEGGDPPSAEDVDARARALGKPQRRDLLRRLREAASQASGGESVEQRRTLLAEALELPADDPA